MGARVPSTSSNNVFRAPGRSAARDDRRASCCSGRNVILRLYLWGEEPIAMKRVGPTLCFLLPVVLAAPAVLADAHLVLLDDRVLSGTSVELQGDLYLLTLESGDVLPLPVALVSEVHRTAKANDAATGDEEPEVLPLLEIEQVRPRPTEVLPEDYGVVERPRRLIELPDGGRSASSFSRSLLDPRFVPLSDYEEKPMLGVFGESRWPGGVIDPNWEQESGFELPEGEPTILLDRWYKSAYRSIWKPEDGFAGHDE